jgi:hypothetical protein
LCAQFFDPGDATPGLCEIVMESHKFEIEPEENYRREEGGRGCAGGCLKGCFIMLLLMVVIIAVLAYVVSQNWREWAASFADAIAIPGALDATNLPEQEKQEIHVELRRPLDALRTGELKSDQIGDLIEAIVESPLLPTLALSVLDATYFEKSNLAPGEIAAGRLALRRFARGVIDNKIGEQAVERVLSHIADRDGDQWVFREQVSDDDLRDLIITAAQEADATGVPEQVEEVDPSDEIRRLIDAVMGPPNLQPPGAPPAQLPQ